MQPENLNPLHLEHVLVTQSCPPLCNPMDCGLPGFSIHGIFPGKNTLVTATKTSFWDFCSSPMVKNSPSNTGEAGLIPGQETKIPHAEGQLSL